MKWENKLGKRWFKQRQNRLLEQFCNTKSLFSFIFLSLTKSSNGYFCFFWNWLSIPVDTLVFICYIHFHIGSKQTELFLGQVTTELTKLNWIHWVPAEYWIMPSFIFDCQMWRVAILLKKLCYAVQYSKILSYLILFIKAVHEVTRFCSRWCLMGLYIMGQIA